MLKHIRNLYTKPTSKPADNTNQTGETSQINTTGCSQKISIRKIANTNPDLFQPKNISNNESNYVLVDIDTSLQLSKLNTVEKINLHSKSKNFLPRKFMYEFRYSINRIGYFVRMCEKNEYTGMQMLYIIYNSEDSIIQYNIGRMYEYGLESVPHNIRKAQYWYEESAKNGNRMAIKRLNEIKEKTSWIHSQG